MSCSRDAAPPPEAPEAVRVIPAVAADVPLEIAAIGNVEAISTVDVKARVTAPVIKVHFAEGQDVQRGQLLFELDPEPFNRQIEEMEANVARDVANQKQAEANVLRDEATWRNLNSIAARTSSLLKEGIMSHEQSEQARANADSAKASLDADRAAADSAKAAERSDRAKLRETSLQVEYTKIYAPITGRAGAIAIKQGSLAKQDDNTLVTLLQIAPVYVTFSVPEQLLPDIRRFNSASPLTIKAIAADNRTGNGTLQFIDNTVDSTTGTIRLKASFPNADRLLWPGQFVNVKARLALEHDRILISSQTIQTGPNGKFVWIFNPTDSTVAMRPVTVLRLYSDAGKNEKAVIASGLKPGEQVISEGQMRLAPKAKVRLLQPIS